MAIKSHITDSATKLTAQVIKKDACECQALAVATIPFREFENDLKFFTNDTYGVNMNISVSFGNTPEEIYNADDTLWTATDIVGGGKTTFISPDQNHTSGGTNSLKVDKAPVDDVYQLAKGSDIVMSVYTALSMWIYVDKDWLVGDSVLLYGWDTDTNTQVGTIVDLSNYFSFSSYGTWHKIIIPLTDMGVEVSITLDALRVKQGTPDGKAPKYYLDDIQFEQEGTPIKYTVKADKGTWLYVEEFTISLANDITGTLADATMPYLPYDSLLGVSLISGLQYKRKQNGVITFSTSLLNLLDFLQLAGTEISSYGSDGKNTWVTAKAKFNEPLLLKFEDEDELYFTISDDLSGLLRLRVTAGCRKEIRTDLNKLY